MPVVHFEGKVDSEAALSRLVRLVSHSDWFWLVHTCTLSVSCWWTLDMLPCQHADNRNLSAKPEVTSNLADGIDVLQAGCCLCLMILRFYTSKDGSKPIMQQLPALPKSFVITFHYVLTLRALASFSGSSRGSSAATGIQYRLVSCERGWRPSL